MLKDILQIIYDSRMYSKSYIAKELNTSEDLVESAVNQLIKMGYLEEDLTSISCQGNCRSCPLANCDQTPLKTYSLTEKGNSYLNL